MSVKAIKPLTDPKLGSASVDDINYLAQAIRNAKLPVLLLGNGASTRAVTKSIRKLLEAVKLPVVETFQGAGIVSRELEEDTFFGRVGLFRNQPGDMLLKKLTLLSQSVMTQSSMKLVTGMLKFQHVSLLSM